MSIFFDFDVGTKGRRFRRAVSGDKCDVEAIIDKNYTEPTFGDIDIGSLIELSTLSICMIDDKKEVTGFMAVCDHPNIPGVDPADWEVWIRNMFQKYYLSRNTLFIQFVCYKDEVKDFFMEEALLSIFQNDVYLWHIILIVPSNVPNVSLLKYTMLKGKNIWKYQPQRNDCSDRSLCMYAALRKDFWPNIKIRLAVEEDNDDVVEILGKNCSRLQEMYGDFYISEIIGRHPEMHRKIIVAESQDHIVGVMCLNSDVHYKMLQDTYEVASYHNLCKASALEKELNKRSNEVLRVFGDPIMEGKWRPFNDDFMRKERKSSLNERSKPKEEPKKTYQSRVLFNPDESVTQTIDWDLEHEISEEIPFMSYSPYLTDQSNVDLQLEEDSFDYEIINIDKNLLTVPEVLSHEVLLPTEMKRRISRAMETKLSANRRRSSLKSNKVEEKKDADVGEPNAFIIELFGIREGTTNIHAFELLEGAFETMKDYDYCIIRVPCEEKSLYLLQHFSFVPTRSNVCSKYALYVAHRCSVLGKLRVRRAEIVDIPQVANFLQSLESKESKWTVENTIMKKSELECYVFMTSVTLVGVGILEPPDSMDYLRVQLNVDPYRIHKHHITEVPDGGAAMIKRVLIYPVFETHFRFFAREMMRLSGNTTLLWLTAYRNKWHVYKANSLVISMIPLLPRKSEIKGRQSTSDTELAYNSWLISKKFTSIPKVNIDTRIVIVGASRTALAFLNALLFSDSSTYLLFTNVTLVSPSGLPCSRDTESLADMMFNYYKTNSDRYLKSVPYTYYVNVITGIMTEINKREKYIKISSGSRYYYDILFLLFGKQYQLPNYMKDIKNKENLCVGDGTVQGRLEIEMAKSSSTKTENIPRNLFVINNIADARKALRFVSCINWKIEDSDRREERLPLTRQNKAGSRKLIISCKFSKEETWIWIVNLEDGRPTKRLVSISNNDFLILRDPVANCKIIVYGSTLNAYCCLAALIEKKVPGENIIFVEPFPDENTKKTRVSLFNNIYVDQTVQEVLKKLNINIYRSYYFQSWCMDLDDMITHVEFYSQTKFVRLACCAFFYYGIRGVNEEAFIAINMSGMVYDGGILIDHKFRTKDPSIYAAGPATRYYRQYYANSKRQKYYDAYEVGWKLGTQIRNNLDPLYPEKVENQNEVASDSTKKVNFDMPNTSKGYNGNYSSNKQSYQKSQTNSNRDLRTPNFKSPLVTHCTLPGGLQYLDIQSPGKKIPHQYVQSMQYNGYVLETFKEGYFKLHLTKDLKIDGITCLTTEDYPLENFKNLFGLSSLVLNNVYLRYTTKKLDNFYQFFLSPWASYLYHDQRDELFAMVKELLPKGQAHGDTLGEALQSVARHLSDPSLNTVMQIRSKIEKSLHFESITSYVIEWLSENEEVLPMYLSPNQKSRLIHDPNMKTTFKKKKQKLIHMLSKII